MGVKYWKDGKPVGSTINRCELHLDDTGHEAGVLYFAEGVGYYFRTYIGGGCNERMLSAKTLNEAKAEAENMLAEWYKTQIEAYEYCIKSYNDKLLSLKQGKN